MKYAIMLVAASSSGEFAEILQLQGPLNSKDHAVVLAGRMNDRIEKVNPDEPYTEFGPEFIITATVLEMEPVKVKQADKLAKKFLGEMEEESRLQVSIPGGGWVTVDRKGEEVVHSELLNGPGS